MRPNEHNKPALEWILNVYNERMYGRVDKSSIATRPSQSDYRPKARDNAMVDLCPNKNKKLIIKVLILIKKNSLEYPDVNKDKSQIQLDE